MVGLEVEVVEVMEVVRVWYMSHTSGLGICVVGPKGLCWC